MGNGKLSGKPDEMLGEQHCERLSSLSGWSSDTHTHFMLRKPRNQETRPLSMGTDFTFSPNFY